MTTALAMLTDVEYQSKVDSSEEKATWVLRSLSGLEMLDCTRKGYVDDVEILHKGLTGWKNFVDGNGTEIPFDQDNFHRVNALILQDLSFEIQNMSAITEDERKNL